ncbi:hypothetical protein L837_3924 [Mycobacterium avium MAV_061107_1842]|nr:hypothetical protein L837_3924 [Mycobacterium avium MAV_061107_1842]
MFKAFSDFGFDDIPAEAAVSRRMLRRLADIDNSTTPARLPRLRGPPWRPASSHMPWSNSRINSSN